MTPPRAATSTPPTGISGWMGGASARRAATASRQCASSCMSSARRWLAQLGSRWLPGQISVAPFAAL